MINYKPVALRSTLAAASLVPPPSPDVLYTGYTGIPGAIETLLVLGATGSAAWLGITTALQKNQGQTKMIVGWIGGVGAAIAGILYLGGKTGLNQMISLPAVRVTPD